MDLSYPPQPPAAFLPAGMPFLHLCPLMCHSLGPVMGPGEITMGNTLEILKHCAGSLGGHKPLFRGPHGLPKAMVTAQCRMVPMGPSPAQKQPQP